MRMAQGMMGVAVLVAWVSAAGAGEVVSRKVELPDGTPAASARVLVRIGEAGGGLRTDVRVETDAEGVFRAEVDIEPNQPKGVRPGYIIVDAPGCALGVALLPLTDDLPPLRLSEDFQLTGIVQVQMGQPVAGVEVMVEFLSAGREADQWGGIWWINSPRQDAITPELVTTSGEDGTFVLRGVTVEGASRLEAACTPLATGWKGRRRAIPIEDNPQPPVLTVWPVIEVSGTVRDALSDEPIPGAQVLLSASPRLSTGEAGPVEADEEGRFAFREVRASKRLRIIGRDKNHAEGQIEIPPDQSTGDAILPLKPVAPVTGRLIDQDTGQPPNVPQVLVMFIYGSPTPDAGMFPSQRGIAVREDGTFAFRPAVGTNTVYVRGGTYEIAEPMTVEMPPEGLGDLLIPARRRPGYLLRFEADDPARLRSARVEYRGRDGRVMQGSMLSSTGFWSRGAPRWGAELELRLMSKDEELLPWTKVTAQPGDDPQVIHIP